MNKVRNDASQAQILAAQPDVSTWLSANAGSGKTRVLTDRVARLLLNEVDAQKILCLTYTKAAATEMQNRLFKRLGAWAMLPDDALREELFDLGYNHAVSAGELIRARTLFARAIETPGGLKIQTIHAFCASVLRRFPLEAGVSPDFSEMEDRAAELLRASIVDDMALCDESKLVTDIARIFTGAEFDSLTRELVSKQDAFFRPFDRAAAFDDMGFESGLDGPKVLSVAFDGSEAGMIEQLCEDLKEIPNATHTNLTTVLSGLNWKSPGQAELQACKELFLYRKGDEFAPAAKTGSIPTKKARENLGDRLDDFTDFMNRVARAHDAELSLDTIDRTEILHAFAARFLNRYARAKQQRGWLDFDDLIRKTRDLLSNKSVAAWVLYRLDGGIDHILIDEAQDTSPAQWKVIEALADEITSGQGARSENPRTLFVVGDKKQSIYSFQGADPNEFDRMEGFFASKLEGSEDSLKTRALQHSFRSSSAILDVVDKTFVDMEDAGFVPDQTHRAFKTGLPGRVDIWPVVDEQKGTQDEPWHVPLDRKGQTHHHAVLAEHVADQIETLLDPKNPATIPDEKSGSNKVIFRAIRPRDIMILVQGRTSGPFTNIIRALKQRGLPVAGADRLKVGAELAVRDILALLSFLATSEDSLSLATVLKSPIFGWSEQALFNLAHHREMPSLWEALRRRGDEFPETMSVLIDLRKKIDILRPFDLIERILTRHRGRAKLVGRIGQDAEDGIDALLAQALAYERVEIPSLTGFLSWAQADALEIKRQVDSSNDLIRVMTVHGAKGLEAPIVILPDCGARKSQNRSQVAKVGDQTVWRKSGEAVPVAVAEDKALSKEAEERERLRLLYVAMTRAEKWLIVAAAGALDKNGADWYSRVQNGFEGLAAQDHTFSFGEGRRYQFGDWDSGPVPEKPEPSKVELALPDLYTTTPPTPVRPETPRSPSKFGGPKALPSELGMDEETAKARGSYVHKLIEVLPSKVKESWSAIMEESAPEGLEDRVLKDAQAEALQVLSDPNLAWVFDANSLPEVAVQGKIDGHKFYGIIDRLIVTDARITVVDFKTNAAVPSQPKDCPSGILAQMGAYLKLIEDIYPEREIDVGIIWTAEPSYMSIPHNMVRQALIEAPYLDVDLPAT